MLWLSVAYEAHLQLSREPRPRPPFLTGKKETKAYYLSGHFPEHCSKQLLDLAASLGTAVRVEMEGVSRRYDGLQL